MSISLPPRSPEPRPIGLRQETNAIGRIFLALLFVGLVCTQYTFSSWSDERQGFDPTLSEQLERGEEGMASRQIGLVLTALGGCGAWWLARRRGQAAGPAVALSPLLIAAAAYALISVAWADTPALSLKRWIAAVLAGAGAMAASASFTEDRLVRLLFLCTLLQAAAGIALEAAAGTFAPLSADYRFAGGLHPNLQAVVCALLLAAGLVIWRRPVRRLEGYLALAGAALGLGLLFLTRSRTAFAAALATGYLFALLSAPSGRRRIALLAGAGMLGLLVLLSPGARSAAADAVLLGRGTDTDRSPIWQDCLEYVAARPILGYGYNSFWNSAHIEEIGGDEHWGVAEAHSSYLEILLDGGMVGALLDLALFASVVLAAWRVWRRAPSPHHALFLAILMFAGLHGLLESQSVRPSLLMLVTAAAVAQIAKAHGVLARTVHARRYRPGALVSPGATLGNPLRRAEARSVE